MSEEYQSNDNFSRRSKRSGKKRCRVLLILVLCLIILAAAVLAAGIITGFDTGKALQAMAQVVTPAVTPDSPAATRTPVPTASPEPSPSPVPTQPPKKLEIAAVGDIMLGRKVGRLLEQKGNGYSYAFEQVAPLLKKGDIVFGNLESPLTANEKSLSREHKIILKARPEAISAITFAGFNLLSIANNHMMDFYDQGMLDTMDLLNRNNIAFTGGGKDLKEATKLAIVEKNGLKFGLLAYSDMAEYTYAGNPSITYAAGNARAGVAPRKLELIMGDIAHARGQVDILAVSLHWGVEESFTIPDSQVRFAHQLIDAGADMILGHHPHQFQGMELYKGKPVIYSMGNFLFDQNDPENQETFIVNLQYDGNKLEACSATPVRIIEKHRDTVQKGNGAAAMLQREAGLSRKLGAQCEIQDDRLVFTAP